MARLRFLFVVVSVFFLIPVHHSSAADPVLNKKIKNPFYYNAWQPNEGLKQKNRPLFRRETERSKLQNFKEFKPLIGCINQVYVTCMEEVKRPTDREWLLATIFKDCGVQWRDFDGDGRADDSYEIASRQCLRALLKLEDGYGYDEWEVSEFGEVAHYNYEALHACYIVSRYEGFNIETADACLIPRASAGRRIIMDSLDAYKKYLMYTEAKRTCSAKNVSHCFN